MLVKKPKTFTQKSVVPPQSWEGTAQDLLYVSGKFLAFRAFPTQHMKGKYFARLLFKNQFKHEYV